MVTDKHINQTYGFLTILKKIRQKESGQLRSYYICQCICGNKVTRRSDHIDKALTTLKNRISSCGCKHPSKIRGHKSRTWSGYGKLSGQFWADLKQSAKIRNIKVDITKKDCWDLLVKQNFKCALTKVDLYLPESVRTKTQEQTASIDRIDSSKAYTIDNIQWVHKDVNKMKNNLSLDRFIELCKLITQNN